MSVWKACRQVEEGERRGETTGLSHEERIDAIRGREGAVGGSLRSHSKEAWVGGSEILPLM